MNRIWLKSKAHKCVLLLRSRPFFALILPVLVMSPRTTALRSIDATCLLVLCSLATAACVALRTGQFLRFLFRTGEFQSGTSTGERMSGSLCIEGCQNRTCCIRTEAPPACWMYRLARTLQQACFSLFPFVKTHFLSIFRGEDLFEGGVTDSKRTFGPEQLASDIKASKIQLGRETAAATDLADKNCHVCSPCQHGLPLSTDFSGPCCHRKAISCTHGLVYISDAEDCKIKQPFVNGFSQDDDSGDVPDLEDCTTPGEEDEEEDDDEEEEEEEVCKRVLETTTNVSTPRNYLATVSDAMLQPLNVVKAANFCPSEDEHSIEKHQILPLEGCKQCRRTDHNKTNLSKLASPCNCNTRRDGKEIEITDAELQKSASDYYTLEGDVLWSKDDIEKQGNAPPSKTSCEFCKQEGNTSQKISVFSLNTQTEVNTIAQAPASSKLVHYADAKRPLEESAVDEIVRASVEELNEDAAIDQGLRAIARLGNEGESSKYMSTASSFRDGVGSFRDVGSFWLEYDTAQRAVGCCDNHARACILHSKSRSKVLQTDPLLSKTSLIREQEIMDMLWQEYDDDKRQKSNMPSRHQKEIAQKQRAKLGVDHANIFGDTLNEGGIAELSNVPPADYVMKLNKADDYDAKTCRFGYDKPCWAKVQGYRRRRHFVGVCKLLREFGLKQCMQRSKVDN